MRARDRLTCDELAQLDRVAFVAMNLLRERNANDGTVSPCWLTMSSEAKDEAIEKALKQLSISMGRNIDRLFLTLNPGITDEMLHQWQDAEADFKLLREEGNARAFFMSG